MENLKNSFNFIALIPKIIKLLEELRVFLIIRFQNKKI